MEQIFIDIWSNVLEFSSEREYIPLMQTCSPILQLVKNSNLYKLLKICKIITQQQSSSSFDPTLLPSIDYLGNKKIMRNFCDRMGYIHWSNTPCIDLLIEKFWSKDSSDSHLHYLNPKLVEKMKAMMKYFTWSSALILNDGRRNEHSDHELVKIALKVEWLCENMTNVAQIYKTSKDLLESYLKDTEEFSLGKYKGQTLYYKIYWTIISTQRFNIKPLALRAIEGEFSNKITYIISTLSPTLTNDQDIILSAIKKEASGSTFFSSNELKSNREFILKAVKTSCTVLNYVTEPRILEDPELIYTNPHSISFASKKLARNKDIALFAVKYKGKLLQYFHDFQVDNEVVMAAVKQDGLTIQYARIIKDYETIAKEAIRQNRRAYTYLQHLYTSKKEFIMELVKIDGLVLEYTSFRDDPVVIREAVRQNGLAIQFANFKNNGNISNEYSSDSVEFYEIAMAAIEQNPLSLEFIKTNDKDLIMKAIHADGIAIAYAPHDYRSMRSVVIDAVKSNGMALKYADASLKEDIEICKLAVQSKEAAYIYVPNHLKHYFF